MNRTISFAFIIWALILVMGCNRETKVQFVSQLFQPIEPVHGTGNIILFASDRMGNLNLFQMDTSGLRQEAITHHPKADYSGSWQKGGIRFRSGRGPGNKAQNYFMTLPERNVSLWDDKAQNMNDPNVSPDQKFLAFRESVGDTVNLYFRELESQKVVKVTDDQFVQQVQDWSPDGRYLLYKQQDSLKESFPQLSSELFIYDRIEEVSFQITQNDRWDGEAKWNPNGTGIVFTSATDSTNNIFILTDTSKAPIPIAPSESIERNPSWAPNGEYLLFESDRTGNFEIFRYRLADGKLDQLTDDPGRDVGPSWQPLF